MAQKWSTRASESDEGKTSRPESGDGRPLVAEENPEIVSRGPGAEEPLGEPATVDTFTPRVGAVATESKEHGVKVKVGETPTPLAAENRAELIPYRPMAGAPYRPMAGETPTLMAMRNQLAPPEQSIWSHHLMRGPRRGSPQGLGDQRHHQL